MSSDLIETPDLVQGVGGEETEVAGEAESAFPDPTADARRFALWALMLLPAGLVSYLAFNAGGFFPGQSAFVAAFLCVILAARVIFAENPLGGISWRLVFVLAALSLLTLETLLSKGWSHAPGVTLGEYDLPLVYLLVTLLFGSVPHRGRRLALMLRALTAAIVVISAIALITRLLPHLWPTAPDIANSRLSYPITYWNALGLFAAMGAVLCVHFASDARERWVVRVLAAAALPIQACTVYFTFSRGGIAAAALGLAVYVVLGRPRPLLSTALSAGPATAIALVVAYHANLLATYNPTTPGAVGQGHHVAVVLGVCIVFAAVLRAALLALDQRLERLRLPALVRRGWVGWACLGAVVVIGAIALHSQIAHEYQRFLNPAPVNTADLRARLTDPGNNNRTPVWKVAWHGFQSAPLLGHGAGSFANTWTQNRPNPIFVLDAHSLYMETLDELGVVGFVLLVSALLAILVGIARRMRGPRRPLYAVAFAVVLAWAVHAGIDWDWEMPVLTVIPFAVGGSVLAHREPKRIRRTRQRRSAPAAGSEYPRRASRGRRGSIRPRSRQWRPSSQIRVALAVGCLLLAVSPTYVWLAQRRLDTAVNAFDAGNCQMATSAALSSISFVGINAEPYEILGYCDIQQHRPNLALAAVRKAISLNPQDSDYFLELAIIRAAAGLNPIPAARQAASLNPRDPDVQQVWLTLHSARPSQWQSDGMSLVSEFSSL